MQLNDVLFSLTLASFVPIVLYVCLQKTHVAHSDTPAGEIDEAALPMGASCVYDSESFPTTAEVVSVESLPASALAAAFAAATAHAGALATRAPPRFERPIDAFKCGLCGQTFGDAAEFKAHQTSHLASVLTIMSPP